MAKALMAELLSIVQRAPLERVSASVDDLLKVEAPMTSPWKQLSACWQLGWMLASLHIGRREAEIANPRRNRRSDGERNENAWIFLTFGKRGVKTKQKQGYNEEANESDS